MRSCHASRPSATPADTRLNSDALFFDGEYGQPITHSVSAALTDALEEVRWAPSAVNKQPWRIILDGLSAHFYEKQDKGYVSGKAALGVSFDSRYNTVYSRYYRLPDGAFVSYVDEGSCAEKAGIRQGDILMQIGEYSIEDYSDVAAILRHFSAGESSEIRLYRDGQILTVTLSFDEAIPASLKNNT